MQRGFQLFAGSKMVRLQYLFDPSVETLDHAARHCPRTNGEQWLALGVLRWGQAVFDVEVGAQQIKFVLAAGAAFAQTKEAVGELLSVIGQNGADAQRAGAFQVASGPAGCWQRSWP